jgi:hypothetical protein
MQFDWNDERKYMSKKVAESELLAQNARALEEEYFREKEQELIEKLRRRAELQTRRGELSALKGIIDDDVLQTLNEIGYNRHTIELLHLVPLIQVGWASGRVTRKERELIIEAAHLRGISEGSPAYMQLEEWFNKRPEDYFFEKTLRIIGDLVEAAPQPDQARSPARPFYSMCQGGCRLGRHSGTWQQDLR